MKHRIERLEETLKYIEDFSYLIAMMHRAAARIAKNPDTAQLHGILLNYRDFRSALLNAAHTSYEWDAWGYNPSHGDIDVNHMYGFTRLAAQFYAWSRYSRRVFHVSDSLRILLQATQLPHDYGVNDIPWPFDAFAVTFEHPIPIDHNPTKGLIYGDLVFVSQRDCMRQDDRVFTCVSTTTGPFINEKAKNIINTNMQKGRYLDAYDTLHALSGMHDQSKAGVLNVVQDKKRNLPVSSIVGSPDARGSVVNDVVKIVCSLCLYLMTLPNNSRAIEIQKLIPPPQRRQRVTIDGAIRHETEVCMVTTDNVVIDSTELAAIEDMIRRESESRGAAALPPHFRRGYFSRPLGQGANPLAPRTVWHRPTFVNKHLLAPGTLPGGNRTTV
ncbi:hypothetical protein HY620_02810 [Candidatus Uhrbacteria bacterium]|nr:hypothetical protein [Candidatus Uhrbacteria bacterium]